MPGKHSVGFATSGFFGISPTRSRLTMAGCVIAALVIGSVVWALTSNSDDDVRPSLIVIPTAALSGPPEGVITADPVEEESPTPPPAVTSAPATPSSGAPRTTPPAAATTQPEPTREAPTTDGLGAQYVLGSTWNDGFVSNLVVDNGTGSNTDWQVRLTYPADIEIAVTGFWNATASVSGTTLVLDGGPLATGAEIQAGFQATKNTGAQVNPTSCTINGTPCAGF